MDTIHTTDCLEGMEQLESNSVDMVYLDPPFYTNKEWKLCNKDGKTFSFLDKWSSMESYIEYLRERLIEIRRVMKPTASCFIHCDETASHYIKVMADTVFGANNFKREIVWSYRKWANATSNLVASHQIILFYGKTSDIKFNIIYQDYAPSTNIDQLMQKRTRNSIGKTIYKRNSDGTVIASDPKKGVPLSDVWSIPYLNPKAKERCGYPTQKPIELLCRMIELVTDHNDVVLDPFCGSGTTLVASKLLGRHFIGFDISEEATALAINRLANPQISISALGSNDLKESEVATYLKPFNCKPIHRNKGADALIETSSIKTMPIRVQRTNEILEKAMKSLAEFMSKRNISKGILLRTSPKEELINIVEGIQVIDSF